MAESPRTLANDRRSDVPISTHRRRMSAPDTLDTLSSKELHDLAVSRA
jgi:hypothetical protein